MLVKNSWSVLRNGLQRLQSALYFVVRFIWFATDTAGHVLHVASGGGVLPASVAASQANLLPIHPHFVTRELTKRELQILHFCQQPRSRKDILAQVGLGASLTNSTRHITPLLTAGYLSFTIPATPKHLHQQYLTTTRGQQALSDK